MKRSLLSKNEPQQRIAVTFSRGEELKYISHLDMMRLWQRALRRAGMPIAYSQGFNPHPRIAIGAPLAVEVTSEGELIDIFMERTVSLDFFVKAMREQLPLGIGIHGIKEVWLKLPSTQSQLRFAEYKVEVDSKKEAKEIGKAVRSLIKKESLPWEHTRGESVHRYDLRTLIDDIWIIGQSESGYTLGMRLRNDSKGSGRPDQVLRALGFDEPATSIHRIKLILGNN